MLDIAPIVRILAHLTTGTIMMVLLVAMYFMTAICFVVAQIAEVLLTVTVVEAVCMMVVAMVAGTVVVVITIHSGIWTSPLLSLRIFAKPT